jgi:hypothetical protein
MAGLRWAGAAVCALTLLGLPAAQAFDDTQLPDVGTTEQPTKVTASSQLPDETTDSGDPFVLLDAAKVQIGNGQLAKAGEMLAAIPLGHAEPYVAQEVLLQRLLLASAALNACGSLQHDLAARGFGASSYAAWVGEQRGQYGRQFAELAQQYLNETRQGLACDFVRFRLPLVTVEHLKDLEMYADPQVLKAAADNWKEDKQGLGLGLVATQERVALVLAAAPFYDLPEASSTIEGVAARLHAGVPLAPPTVLDWLAQSAAQAGSLPELAAVQRTADGRLAPLLQSAPDSLLKARYDKRNGLEPPAPETKMPPKHKGRSNKRKGKTSR